MTSERIRWALTDALIDKAKKEGRIRECGDCRKWITRDCPRERNVNGWNRGPSSKDMACKKFDDGKAEDDE